jgi:hypothetical protein
VVIDEPLGSISQRNGYETCGVLPSGNTATVMYTYTKINGVSNLIVSDNITHWQTSDCIEYTVISTGHDQYAVPRFATIRDKLWIVNGQDYPETWDGTAMLPLDGSDGRPNVPKGKYIAWFKSRVFIGNTPTEPSGVYFSAVASPSGTVLDPAVSSQAWTNTSNLVYFNRGDGSQLYGLKVYRDNLYAFKETGVNRLLFQSEYNLNVIKNVTNIGSKFQESIVEMDDGYLRYMGRDGIYKFDGSSVVRNSSKWYPTFKLFQQPNGIVENYYTWALGADWLTGTLTNFWSPDDKPASLVMHQANPLGPNIGAESGDASNWDSLTGYAVTSAAAADGTKSFITTVHDYRGNFPGFSVELLDNANNVLATGNVLCNNGSWKSNTLGVLVPPLTSTVYVRITYRVYDTPTHETISTITYGPVMAGKTLAWAGQDNMQIVVYGYYNGAMGAGHSAFDISEVASNTGSYESAPYRAIGVTLWKDFLVNETLNGATITYYIRTAGTQAGLAAASYAVIHSGDLVSAGTDSWVQWKAESTTSNMNATPEITSVQLNWVTGALTKSLVTGINYKSRYWIAASKTVGGMYNDITMVESKPPLESHTLYDLPLSAMTLWNGYLYGAIGGTAKLAKLDTGATDDATAITSYWTSRDEVYDNPLANKSINRLIVDYSAYPANTSLSIGLSPDFGVTWADRHIDTSEGGLARNTRNINLDANRDLQFRSRIFNDTLGLGWKIYGLHSFGTATNFLGN